ncbi:uncharacterized protein G2W53_037703 [Senna tora]|uniref:Uncharacterized protein n=1 Tax=Senna tora TaxID=362788 RepID=A0A834SKT5_9FABA|nr:uncharacterized protein G2W53_037703 [Senna tora]
MGADTPNPKDLAILVKVARYCCTYLCMDSLITFKGPS